MYTQEQNSVRFESKYIYLFAGKCILDTACLMFAISFGHQTIKGIHIAWRCRVIAYYVRIHICPLGFLEMHFLKPHWGQKNGQNAADDIVFILTNMHWNLFWRYNQIRQWYFREELCTKWWKIIYPFPNVNGGAVEDWEWMSNSITQFTGHVITYPCWD